MAEDVQQVCLFVLPGLHAAAFGGAGTDLLLHV